MWPRVLLLLACLGAAGAEEYVWNLQCSTWSVDSSPTCWTPYGVPGAEDDVRFTAEANVKVACSDYGMPYGICEPITFAEVKAQATRRLLQETKNVSKVPTEEGPPIFRIDTLDGPHSVLEVGSIYVATGAIVNITTNVFLHLTGSGSSYTSEVHGTLELHAVGWTVEDPRNSFGGVFGESHLNVYGTLNLCGGILWSEFGKEVAKIKGNLTVNPGGQMNMGCGAMWISYVETKILAQFLYRPTVIKANAKLVVSSYNMAQDTIPHAGMFWGFEDKSSLVADTSFMPIENYGAFLVKGYFKLHAVEIHNQQDGIITIEERASLIDGEAFFNDTYYTTRLVNDGGTLDIKCDECAYGVPRNIRPLDGIDYIHKADGTAVVSKQGNYVNYNNITLRYDEIRGMITNYGVMTIEASALSGENMVILGEVHNAGTLRVLTQPNSNGIIEFKERLMNLGTVVVEASSQVVFAEIENHGKVQVTVAGPWAWFLGQFQLRDQGSLHVQGSGEAVFQGTFSSEGGHVHVANGATLLFMTVNNLGSHGYEYLPRRQHGAAAEKMELLNWSTETTAMQVTAMREAAQDKDQISWAPPTVSLSDTVFEGEGRLLSTTPIRVAKDVQINTHSAQLLLDGWALLSGPGNLVIGKKTSLVLGVNSTLNGDAAITVYGKVSIESHVHISLHGYSIILCPGGSMDVQGKLEFGATGHIEECGGTAAFVHNTTWQTVPCKQTGACASASE